MSIHQSPLKKSFVHARIVRVGDCDRREAKHFGSRTTIEKDTINPVTTTSFLLVGPHDPNCGEFTFLAPPLGVWRLAGALRAAGFAAEVFDPNCCEGDPFEALEKSIGMREWDVIGFSTTGMTLQWDLALAHRARALRPDALLVAGGMEATFQPELMFELGPFDLVGLGEGERSLKELGRRLSRGESIERIAGTAWVGEKGVMRIPQPSLTREEMRDSIFLTPYEEMPYERYWQKLEASYRVGQLPTKAAREASLAEIRSVRLITLNYCPMGCSFCSSTNFLNEAQGATAPITRLDEHEILSMVERICSALPSTRTIIFQDDIFVFTQDRRILPLCELIVEAKREGTIPADLQFISTNRIDAMTPERLVAMKSAGFRVLGFGVENFSLDVLREFRKARVHSHVEPVLEMALRLGIRPFLDLILTSPRGSLEALSETIRESYRWATAGCEIGMYPYVIPFSGAEMALDPGLASATVSEPRSIAGTSITWRQPAKILPLDPIVREAIIEIEYEFEQMLKVLQGESLHIPSRVRSYLWVACAIPVLEKLAQEMPPIDEVLESLLGLLPGPLTERRAQLFARFDDRRQVGVGG